MEGLTDLIQLYVQLNPAARIFAQWKSPVWNGEKGAHGSHMVLQCLSLIGSSSGPSCLTAPSPVLSLRGALIPSVTKATSDLRFRVSPLGSYAPFLPLPVVQIRRPGNSFASCVVTSSSLPAGLFRSSVPYRS